MVYDLKTNDFVNPIGIDSRPKFSWKLKSDKQNTLQLSYSITVSDMLKNIIWKSGEVLTDESINIEYNGKLKPCTKYCWNVKVRDNHGFMHESVEAYFETGLMGSCQSLWNGAQWIGSPKKTVNTDGLADYAITVDFIAEDNAEIGIAINARDKDNYILISLNTELNRLSVYEYNDNAWTTEKPSVKTLGSRNYYKAPKLCEKNKMSIEVRDRTLSVSINGIAVIDNEENFIPRDIPNLPRRQALMKFGFKQEKGSVSYYNIRVENTKDKTVYIDGIDGNLTVFGEKKENLLTVSESFNLVSPVPPVNVRKKIKLDRKIKSARMYAAARGSYDVYINGKMINKGYFNPGFTDYRKRIQYQTYDITDSLNMGKNIIGAVVAKGYYSGFVGYSRFPMVYGNENSFLAKMVIEYEYGEPEIIVTDDSWQYTDVSALIDSDYQQGESYDARLELISNDERYFKNCGIKEWQQYAEPTNGMLDNEKFELSAQLGPAVTVERVLKPVTGPIEAPAGHFVYDFGQNMVGTVRVKLKGECGSSIKLRYGEMKCADGKIYIKNLRSAACTDTYTFKGNCSSEIFEPRFTSHGFRYVEISGNGEVLSHTDIDNMVLEIEGLVLTNTTEITGGFECSDKDINKLQSNIQWGQRGNSLLVFTDCPQRNERMGWTGDAQVFAGTAAYNINVKSFMDKWLLDVRDAQLMYNRNGAVPDTAPLGGDNRPMGGCAGWGDAAVIVPWKMYMAYGDINFLKNNYSMMKAWVEYQNGKERRSFGARNVNGNPAPSDLASEDYIQVQQSRGDHLAYDRSTPFILTATAYAAHAAEIISKTAEILGKTEDSKKYRQRFEKIKKAFNEAWVKEDGSIAYWGEQSIGDKDSDGNVINETYYSHDGANIPSQTAYAVAVDFGLLPKEKSERIRECFKQTIDKQDGKLSVGFLGISHLAPALVKAGLTKEAFSLLEERRNPSWLYSVMNGATTIWERWSSYIAETDTFGEVSMNSFNHYAYGAIGEWMMSYIAGINPLKPGYKEINLEPHIGGSLEYASAWHDTPYGKVSLKWQKYCGKIKYTVEIPANTRARAVFPGEDERLLGSGKYEFIFPV
ncbi:MAG: family 78 glycoside hydrolase catalytic domain [bacterium]|nr:family 78 glycoside hydrolase catalytic domain [bacterium]